LAQVAGISRHRGAKTAQNRRSCDKFFFAQRLQIAPEGGIFTMFSMGGDLASTPVAKPSEHAEAQNTS